MDSEEVPGLTEVDEERFIIVYNSAAGAVRRAGTSDAEDRWAVAARETCELLGFIVENDALWTGLHEAIDAADEHEILEVQQRLAEFIDAEYELLIRRGLTEAAAAEITNTVTNALIGLASPTHEELEEVREALRQLYDEMCRDVLEWSQFSDPERRARIATNTNAVIGGAGGLLGATSNALSLLIPPFIAGSIIAGAAGGIAALRSLRRRR